MRGDSLRDFYAKVIAVLGLGVLAGAGALVDYWPSGGMLPRVASLTPDVALAGPLPVPAIDARIAPRPAALTQIARQTPAAEMNPIELVSAPIETVVMVPNEPPASFPVAHVLNVAHLQAATLAAPPQAAPVPAAVETDVVIDDDVALPAWRDAAQTPPVATADEDGFFMGAVRKTKDSIVRTGRKTGASIFDAFRFVGGAMKKALPG